MMKFSLSKRDQQTLLLAGGAAALTLWVYSTMFIGPLWRKATSLGQQVRSARQEFSVLERVTANEAAIQAQHEQLNRTVKSLRSLLPAEEELPAVIEFLSDLASQTQVKIQTIFPQRPLGSREAVSAGTAAGESEEPEVYKKIPIQIDALAGYHQLGTFLNLVEESTRPMQLASLRISGSDKEPKRHEIKMVILSYFAAGEPASAGEGATAHAAGTR